MKVVCIGSSIAQEWIAANRWIIKGKRRIKRAFHINSKDRRYKGLHLG